MAQIHITKVDETFIKVSIPDKAIEMELSDLFTFDAPNKFASRNRRHWDGKIRLYNRVTKKTTAGLTGKIIEWAREKGYSCKNDTEFTTEIPLAKNINLWAVPANGIEIRDYQLEAVTEAIRKRRCVLVSPTASGKSLIAYLLADFIFSQLTFGQIKPKPRILIVVPTLSLVKQMQDDFIAYGSRHWIQCIGGKNKDKSVAGIYDIVISTWQSIYELPTSWFNEFDCIIGDEAHNYKAKSLISLMTSACNIKYRFGMTGTLDDTKVNPTLIEGLFGPVVRVATTEELIQQKHLSPLHIHALVLKHGKMSIPSTYQEEITYLISHRQRNGFICNLARSLTGKTLILYDRIEDHGDELFRILSAKIPVANLHYVNGKIPSDEREEIRNYVNKSTENEWILASYGTFSTGINIPGITNIIFASPTKSKIKLLQSIGRGLRKSLDKVMCNVYDIADNFEGDIPNYTLKHFIERIRIYNEESFEYKIHSIRLTKEGENALF